MQLKSLGIITQEMKKELLERVGWGKPPIPPYKKLKAYFWWFFRMSLIFLPLALVAYLILILLDQLP